MPGNISFIGQDAECHFTTLKVIPRPRMVVTVVDLPRPVAFRTVVACTGSKSHRPCTMYGSTTAVGGNTLEGAVWTTRMVLAGTRSVNDGKEGLCSSIFGIDNINGLLLVVGSLHQFNGSVQRPSIGLQQDLDAFNMLFKLEGLYGLFCLSAIERNPKSFHIV